MTLDEYESNLKARNRVEAKLAAILITELFGFSIIIILLGTALRVAGVPRYVNTALGILILVNAFVVGTIIFATLRRRLERFQLICPGCSKHIGRRCRLDSSGRCRRCGYQVLDVGYDGSVGST
jgi:hypothetical protein